MPRHAMAKIISFNAEMIDICASAARISTTEGNALDIFCDAHKKNNNMDLIGKVLKSGHNSLLEHAVFCIAFNEVSVFVEQYIIESRLASFTVKSRRYVNYSNQGYYIPPELNKENADKYQRYMQILFDGYAQLIELGVPKEDARFLLPYSFCSNMYCTINARELLQLLSSILYGRGSRFPELVDIAKQLISQINELFPVMLNHLVEKKVATDLQHTNRLKTNERHELVRFLTPTELGNIEIIQAPLKPLDLLSFAYSISHPCASSEFDIISILSDSRPRELEQLNYTFSISPITLAGLTHLVRHRMQSIIIPPLTQAHSHLFVLPESISNSAAALGIYQRIIEKAAIYRAEYEKNEQLAEYQYYYTLSGNVIDVMTTMNARELQHFMMLRSCNRAQWEIRTISMNMLFALQNHFPALFSHYGPSCVMQNHCPEGELSCGQINQVRKAFSRLEQ